MRIDPFALHGRHVDLVPLAREHAAELAEAAAGDRASYGYTEVPADPKHAADYIDRLLAQRDADAAVPFAQRRRPTAASSGALGSWSSGGGTAPGTRRGRDRRDVARPDAQRSPINTEAKLLLLVHAFDVWGVRGWRWRPTLATSAAGAPSSASAPTSRGRCATIARRSRRARTAARGTRPCSPSPTRTGRSCAPGWPGGSHRLRSPPDGGARRLRPPPRGQLQPRRRRGGACWVQRAGHEVTTLDLYAMEFALPWRCGARAYHGDQPLVDPVTVAHAELVWRAEVLVFVYPTWWSGPPAILKGWLERVMVPGVAFRFDDAGKVRPALTNVRRIVGISTYGAPWRYVKLVQDGGRRMLTRALRLNCGVRTRRRGSACTRRHLGAKSGRPSSTASSTRWPTSTLAREGAPWSSLTTPTRRRSRADAGPRGGGAARRGAEVRVTDLADGCAPVSRRGALATSNRPDPAVRPRGRPAVVRQLVFVYPTWWSGQPAALTGWIHRACVNDVAWDLPPQSNRVLPAVAQRPTNRGRSPPTARPS